MPSLNLPEPVKSLLKELEAKAITNFFGEAGTGKTNLSLLAAVECARRGGKVVFIDTEGGFSLERLKQIAPDYMEVLKRIELFEPKDFTEQGKIIRDLRDSKVDLIILDSAVALYRLDYSEPEKESQGVSRELGKQMAILSSIARKKEIPVITTGHTFRRWDTEVDEIVGGGSIKYWSKAIVFLEKTGKMSERRATIVKHRWLSEGESVKFMIQQDGIGPATGFRLIRRQ